MKKLLPLFVAIFTFGLYASTMLAQVDESLIGRWEGVLTQPGFGSFQGKITIDSLVVNETAGSTEYGTPNVICGGTITFEGAMDTIHVFNQTIIFGPCPDARIEIYKLGPDSIQGNWYDPNSDGLVTFGILVREVCPPPTEILLETNSDANFGNTGCGSGGNDGQLVVQPVSGEGPFTYIWSDGSTSAWATGLSDGIYTVTVNDFCGGIPAIQTFSVGSTAGLDLESCGGPVELGPDAPLGGNITDIAYSTAPPVEGVRCQNSDFNTDNTWYRPFDLDDYFGLSGSVNIVGVEIVYDAVAGPNYNGFQEVEFALLEASELDLTVATLTELDRVVVDLPDTDGDLNFRIPLNAVVDASQIIVFEARQFANGPSDGHTLWFQCTDGVPVGVTPSYVVAPSCGAFSPVTYSDIGFELSLIADLLIGQEPDFTYNWEGPGAFSSSMQNPSVNDPGVYTVTITDQNCGTEVIDDVMVTPCTGIVEIEEQTFSVMPNPSNGAFWIQNNGEPRNMQIEVFDLQGRIVVSQHEFLSTGIIQALDLSQVAKGMYILKMTNNNKSEVHRLIFQ